MINILILTFMLFTLSVIAVKYTNKNCTFEEATKICVDFVKNIFKEFFQTSQQVNLPLTYPVLLGFDGIQFSPQEIEHIFSEIGKYFKVFFFKGVNNSFDNRIMYVFNIDTPQTDLNYLDFIRILEKTSQKILKKHFWDFGLDINGENFIVIQLTATKLVISIAKNDIGAKETVELRQMIKENYYKNQIPQEPQKEPTAEWKNEENE